MKPTGKPTAKACAHARSLYDLQSLIWEGRYRVKPHAIRHATAEGFTERDIVRVLETGRELAIYPEDRRMLILGYILVGQLQIPLHVVVDYGGGSWVEVITAFMPSNPYRAVSRERLAILLNYDQAQVRERVVTPSPRARGSRSKHWRAA
jgi:hypothetical protein